jgi:hypothetical protein
MGGADLDDLLNLRPVLATLPGVDRAEERDQDTVRWFQRLP